MNESAWDQFRNEKEDWINICESVLNILKTSTDSKVLDLFSKGKKLLKLFSKFTASLKLNYETQAQNDLTAPKYAKQLISMF